VKDARATRVYRRRIYRVVTATFAGPQCRDSDIVDDDVHAVDVDDDSENDNDDDNDDDDNDDDDDDDDDGV